LIIVAYILVVAAAIVFTIRRRMSPVKTVILHAVEPRTALTPSLQIAVSAWC
jgi:hypothetical protein